MDFLKGSDEAARLRVSTPARGRVGLGGVGGLGFGMRGVWAQKDL